MKVTKVPGNKEESEAIHSVKSEHEAAITELQTILEKELAETERVSAGLIGRGGSMLSVWVVFAHPFYRLIESNYDHSTMSVSMEFELKA